MTNTKNKNKKKKTHRKKTKSPSPTKSSVNEVVPPPPPPPPPLHDHSYVEVIIPDSPDSPPGEDPDIVIPVEELQEIFNGKLTTYQVDNNNQYDLYNPGPSSVLCAERQLMGYVNGTEDGTPMEVDDDEGPSTSSAAAVVVQENADAKSRNEYRAKVQDEKKKQHVSRITTSKGSYCSSDNSTDTASEKSSPETPKKKITKKRSRDVEAKTYPPATPKITSTTMASSSQKTALVTTTTNSLPPTIFSSKETAYGSETGGIPTTTIFNSKDKNAVSLLQQQQDLVPINNLIDRQNLGNALRTYIENPKCAGYECKKSATVRCPACNQFMYCTDKHKKMFFKNHETFCNGYRVIDSASLGRHAITAKEIAKAGLIMTDEPLAKLPLNPEVKTEAKINNIPSYYCVVCLRSLKEMKTEPCECHLPKCIDENECKINQDDVTILMTPTKALNVGHVECNWIKRAQDAHMQEQEAALKKNLLIDLQPEPLPIDQSILGLLRMWYAFRGSEAKELMELFKGVKSQVKSKAFLAKLSFIRSKCGLGPEEVTDDLLYMIDSGIMKCGRNFVEDVAPFCETDGRFVKSIFKKLPDVLHSCVPNSVLTLVPGGDKLSYQLHAIKPMKKGDVIFMMYDDRVLFHPTWKRKAFLQSEFGVICNCKRCGDRSELNTYFSSFPCSNCPNKRKISQGFISCSNPNEPMAHWICSGCKKKSNALRALDLIHRIETETLDYLDDNDIYGLIEWFNRVIELRVLHWNHFTVFYGCIGILETLWTLIRQNDMPTISRFNRTNGLELLQAAEVVLNISEVFHPYGYLGWLVIPLSLAAIIKLRDVSNRLRSNEISLQKVEQIICSIYFRGEGLPVNPPLFQRYNYIEPEGRLMKALELKCMYNLCSASKHVNELAKIGAVAPKLHAYLMTFYSISVEDGISPRRMAGCPNPFVNVLGSEVVRRKIESGLVPWVLEV